MRRTAITSAAAIIVATLAASVALRRHVLQPPCLAPYRVGARWDAAPRIFGGNERSLDGGLRFSLQGGTFQAFLDLIPWNSVPSPAAFQEAVEQAFAAWESSDPVTGLATDLHFVHDTSTAVMGSGMWGTGNANGAEIDLLAVNAGFTAARAEVYFSTSSSTVTLTSGTSNYPGSRSFIGADIAFNNNPGTLYSIDSFRRLLTHEIGHAIGLGDVEPDGPGAQFIDDNYNGTTSTTALATLTNSWALAVAPLNPASSPLAIYDVPNGDPGIDTPGVDILMESEGLGVSPGNNIFNLLPLRNDDYGMRQFLYPSLTFDFPPGDFNHDGTVNAADYVTWRDGLGNQFVDSDYDVWRAHFGESNIASFTASRFVAIPEPGSIMLLLVALFANSAIWCRAR